MTQRFLMGEGDLDWDELRRRSVRLARRYASDPAEVEDVAHDALLRAWRHRHRLRLPDRRAGWLASIVRNEAARRAARPRPEPVGGIEPVEAPAADDAVAAVVERADVRSALARLAVADRLLLDLRYGEDMTQPAIARLLDLPEGTVKVRLHRARNRLQQAFGQDGYRDRPRG